MTKADKAWELHQNWIAPVTLDKQKNENIPKITILIEDEKLFLPGNEVFAALLILNLISGTLYFVKSLHLNTFTKLVSSNVNFFSQRNCFTVHGFNIFCHFRLDASLKLTFKHIFNFLSLTFQNCILKAKHLRFHKQFF